MRVPSSGRVFCIINETIYIYAKKTYKLVYTGRLYLIYKNIRHKSSKPYLFCAFKGFYGISRNYRPCYDFIRLSARNLPPKKGISSNYGLISNCYGFLPETGIIYLNFYSQYCIIFLCVIISACYMRQLLIATPCN